MAASPSTVISLGYGSFGSVNLLPTLGYGSGAVVAVITGIPILCEGMVYFPGLQAGDIYSPGLHEATTFIPGLQAGQLSDCD